MITSNSESVAAHRRCAGGSSVTNMRRSLGPRHRNGVRSIALTFVSTILVANGVLALARTMPASASSTTITDCSDATGLESALSAGGSYVFTCSGTITVQDLVVTKSVSLNATGMSVTLSGGYAGRVFDVQSGTLNLTAVTISAGEATSGDAASNGVDGIEGTGGMAGVSGGGPPTGTDGGGGGDGTAGTAGSDGESATGVAQGGAVLVEGGTVDLTNVTVSESRAVGQNGGNGGNGGSGGDGGAGGAGGCTLYAAGCHIYSGGNGGNGAQGAKGGNGGDGAAAQGGGIYVEAGGSLAATDSTFSNNYAEAGGGGVGGTGGSGGSGGTGGSGSGPWPTSGSGANGAPGGIGGAGASAAGGAIYSLGTLTLSDDTFSGNQADAGSGNGYYGEVSPKSYGGSGGWGGFASTDLYGGPGGPGGRGGDGLTGGGGGDGGEAQGGAIDSEGQMSWSGGSLSSNQAVAGNGGTAFHGGEGGDAGGDGAAAVGGDPGDGGNGASGGNGGDAIGGALFPISLTANGVSCTGDSVTAGQGAPAGAGGAAGPVNESAAPPGSPGASGSAGENGAASGAEPSFCGPPVISSVAPAAGPLGGGNELTISGAGFKNPGLQLQTVDFTPTSGTDETAIPVTDAQVVSSSEITVTAPDATAAAAGAASLSATVSATFDDDGDNVTTSPLESGDDDYVFGAPVIDSVAPASGPLAGNNEVTLTGSGFENATLSLSTVQFDQADGSNVTFTLTGTDPLVVSDTEITVTAPDATGTAAGATTLASSVIANFQDTDEEGQSVPSVAAHSGDNDYFFGTPQITSITPEVGPLLGGNSVTITGSGFKNMDLTLSKVEFQTIGGSGPSTMLLGVTPSIVSDTEITVVAPDASDAADGQTAVVSQVTATFEDNNDPSVDVTSVTGSAGKNDYVFGPPVINSVSPVAGPLHGGNTVTITGSGFKDPDLSLEKIEFTGAAGSDPGTSLEGVDPFVVSDSSITVKAPDATEAAGTKPSFETAITVTFVSEDASNAPVDAIPAADGDTDYSFGSPIIDSVSPVAGPFAGGDTVTITGSGFDSSTLTLQSVTFDGVTSDSGAVDLAGVDPTVDSDDQITVTAPDATDEDSGDVSLDTNVVLTYAASDDTDPDDDLVSLPAQAGANDYVFGAPQITSVDPVAGPLAGGNAVTINGRGFENADLTLVSVDFDPADDDTGGLEGTGATVVSDTEITVTAPDATDGADGKASLDTSVVLQYGLTEDATETVKSAPQAAGDNTYIFGGPLVTSITPVAGPLAGGNEVVITGTGLDNPDLNLSGVVFDPADETGAIDGASPTVVSDTEVTVTAPDATAAAAGKASLDTTLFLEYDDAADPDVPVLSTPAQTAADDYIFGAPEIDMVQATAGPLAGGNTITITGSGFDNPDLTLGDVGFDPDDGGTALDGLNPVVVSDTVITVTAPNAMAAAAANDGSDLDVTIVLSYNDPADAGEQVLSTPAHDGDDAYVFGAPVIDSVQPVAGPLDGGNVVTITGSGFDNPDFSLSNVAFDPSNGPGIDGTDPVVVSDTEMTVTAPDFTETAGNESTVHTTITAAFEDGLLADSDVTTTPSTSGSNGYVFGAPLVESIVPVVGPVIGGNQVTITGSGFDDPDRTLSTVSFDPEGDTSGSEVLTGTNPIVVSDTEITVTAPDATEASGGKATLDTSITAVFADDSDLNQEVASIPAAGGDNAYEFATDISTSGLTATPGGTVDVTATGFQPGETVSITLHSTTVLLATVTASATGAVSTTVTIPASTALDGHELILTGLTSGHSVTILLTVQTAPSALTCGYRFGGLDGGVLDFGCLSFFGSLANVRLNTPIVGIASTPDGGGYWLVASDGGVFSFGDAHFYGSTGSLHLNKPIVGMTVTPSGHGYWLVASDGGIFTFGDARFYGSMGAQMLNKPIVGMAPSRDGGGYWLVASDGGIFSFGDAKFYGSQGGTALNKPIVAMAATPDGLGYWLAASDGGIFSFGDATFDGSMGGQTLNKPIVGMAAAPSGKGYWLVASDGGVFNFGDATFDGSMGGTHLNQPIVGMAAS
jgi:IPT/TIG domain